MNAPTVLEGIIKTHLAISGALTNLLVEEVANNFEGVFIKITLTSGHSSEKLGILF